MSPKTEDKRLVENQMVETQEMHCGKCGRFLGYQAIVWGIVRIKCRICKEWTTLDVKPEKEDLDIINAKSYNRNGRKSAKVL